MKWRGEIAKNGSAIPEEKGALEIMGRGNEGERTEQSHSPMSRYMQLTAQLLFVIHTARLCCSLVTVLAR